MEIFIVPWCLLCSLRSRSKTKHQSRTLTIYIICGQQLHFWSSWECSGDALRESWGKTINDRRQSFTRKGYVFWKSTDNKLPIFYLYWLSIQPLVVLIRINTNTWPSLLISSTPSVVQFHYSCRVDMTANLFPQINWSHTQPDIWSPLTLHNSIASVAHTHIFIA